MQLCFKLESYVYYTCLSSYPRIHVLCFHLNAGNSEALLGSVQQAGTVFYCAEGIDRKRKELIVGRKRKLTEMTVLTDRPFFLQFALFVVVCFTIKTMILYVSLLYPWET